MRRLTLLLATAAAAAPQKDHRTRIKQDGAQDAAGVLSPAPPNRHASWLKALHHADANGDGAVSEGEWRTLAAEHEALSWRFVADAAAAATKRQLSASCSAASVRHCAIRLRRPRRRRCRSRRRGGAPVSYTHLRAHET